MRWCQDFDSYPLNARSLLIIAATCTFTAQHSSKKSCSVVIRSRARILFGDLTRWFTHQLLPLYINHLLIPTETCVPDLKTLGSKSLEHGR